MAGAAVAVVEVRDLGDVAVRLFPPQPPPFGPPLPADAVAAADRGAVVDIAVGAR